jgi:hypothetical protein
MTPREHKAFEICIKSIKSIAVRNQNYEFAAFSRDIEKDLSIPVTSYDQTSIDWKRVNSLDSLQYYDRIERLTDKYSTDKTNEEVKNNLKQLHDVVMISIIRQEIISKILGENEQQ